MKGKKESPLVYVRMYVSVRSFALFNFDLLTGGRFV